ncbi:histidine phosphotransferase [Sulfitobacter alexandrii]|uniref:Histidine phosphotransferase n=1 Tax=Sulfitobacter alexandrii TaxID=1917485 RepID=A0A1J0WMI6_9RHOB|nr:histidine phosphotransferase family protein [Sulfitobacter alexandrii]APE45384.1 histidine phosphotransferase [Sulfitobacter alexandrii]
MRDTQVDLAALIGSRICHDVISPIGAINNGLELLQMADGMSAGPEISLIRESVDNASARIRFFRVAFGAPAEQMLGRSEVLSILGDLYRSSRFSVDWQLDEPQARGAVQLAFLSMLCLESALPFGGAMTVTKDAQKWRLVASADKIRVDRTLWSLLAPGRSTARVQPAHVQFAMLPIFAAEQGRQLAHHATDTTVTIEF